MCERSCDSSLIAAVEKASAADRSYMRFSLDAVIECARLADRLHAHTVATSARRCWLETLGDRYADDHSRSEMLRCCQHSMSALASELRCRLDRERRYTAAVVHQERERQQLAEAV